MVVSFPEFKLYKLESSVNIVLHIELYHFTESIFCINKVLVNNFTQNQMTSTLKSSTFLNTDI